MAERRTDAGQDPGLSFEEWESTQTSVAVDPVDDAETDEIFGRDPVPQPDQSCLFCGVSSESGLSVWVKNGNQWSPFCNQFHNDMFYKVGLWAGPTNLPGLSLD